MTDTDGSRESPHPSSVRMSIGISNTPSVKTHPYGWVLYQIPPSSVRIGIGGQNPPSVIRSGWCRKMGLGIRGRTDRYGDPETDRTAVYFLEGGKNFVVVKENGCTSFQKNKKMVVGLECKI